MKTAIQAVTLLVTSVLCAGQGTPSSSVKAFPTAEGFGADAAGGHGGRVIEVTNLEDSGEGSLRAAMEASGPRVCVFRVSGTITLKEAIRVRTPFWLAGPESGYRYLNVGNGGPVRIDGSSARDGGTKLYLTGNWGPRSPAGSTNDWTGHGVNTWDYYELNHDGMPDAWETTHGLDPGDSRDGAAVAKNRYTNVENYLNELAGDPVP